MKKVCILRGVTGSGKSTWAESSARDALGSSRIVSADNFFKHDGAYKFDIRLLGEAHESCFSSFTEAVRDGIDTIIVDNTNSTRREYAHYAILARAFGYEVQVVEFNCSNADDLALYHSRSVHDVPLFVIEHMLDRWEHDPEAITFD